MILTLFSRRWLLATILVLAAAAVMVRLGIWQLDRLAQRRAFNTRVEAEIAQPPLDFNQAGNIPAGLPAMEYRKVVATGEYDFSQQVVLKNQANGNQLGVDLLTPLKIGGTGQAILVNRGWVPADPNDPSGLGDWKQYNETGKVTVQGVIRQSQSSLLFGLRSDPVPAPGEPRLLAWNFPNVPGISRQVPYPLLPVYIQQSPDASNSGLPVRSQPQLDLSDGPHLGYAIQWFSFALFLVIGYPFFVHRQEMNKKLLRV
jgi:surfeit locus 1 family protein